MRSNNDGARTRGIGARVRSRISGASNGVVALEASEAAVVAARWRGGCQ